MIRSFAMLLFACGILFLSATIASAELKQNSPAAVCAYLAKEGYKMGDYQPDLEEEGVYWTCSQYKEVGKGETPNAIAYFVEGAKAKVTELKLVLNVSERSEAKSAHAALISTGEILLKKAGGAALSKPARAAIEQGKAGEWKLGGLQVRLVREVFPMDKGYSLILVIE